MPKKKNTIKFFTEEIKKEAIKILREGEDYSPCVPNCIRCLCAVAKGNIDKRFNVETSFDDILSGLSGMPSMKTDYAMLQAIEELEEEILE